MGEQKAAKAKGLEAQEISVPIRWDVPEGLSALFANNVVVQHTEREFILSFFQITPPVLIDPKEEEIRKIKEIVATAVARVVLTPATVSELIRILEDNYQKWEVKQLRKE